MSNPKTGSQVAGEGTSSFLQRFLDLLEYIGNKFPSPFTLFLGLAMAVLVLSYVFEGASATYLVLATNRSLLK